MRNKKKTCFLLCLLLVFSLCTVAAENISSSAPEQPAEWKGVQWKSNPRNISMLCLSRFCKDLPVICRIEPVSENLAGIQNHIEVEWDYSTGTACQYNDNHLNIIPEESGFNAPYADETVKAAEEVLEQLGLNGERWKASPLFFASFGRFPGSGKCRKVVFEETLDGLPVRWSASSLYEREASGRLIAKCDIEVVFSDEDILLSVNGNWCSFEPLTSVDNLLPEEEITAIFTSAGKTYQNPEKCWFLHLDGTEASATLAWHVGNSYVNATNGCWLQTGL